ncbi:MAG: carboxypeptidase-like regulatory domain-containing protein, partial [Prevotella sp.]|nr:carboxypeptidase-like regulatory domain-containing protein [Prevotella sp.]
MLFLRGLFVYLFAMIMSVPALAQAVRGVVVDADTGDSLSYVSLKYKGSHVSTISDGWGMFSIARHSGMYITFSAVGYKAKN